MRHVSNNDTMVDELDARLPAFSRVNRTRCFAHILNLIAKSMLKLFDIEKKKEKGDGNGDGNDPDLDLTHAVRSRSTTMRWTMNHFKTRNKRNVFDPDLSSRFDVSKASNIEVDLPDSKYSQNERLCISELDEQGCNL